MTRTDNRYLTGIVAIALLLFVAIWGVSTANAEEEPLRLELAQFTVVVDTESGDVTLLPFDGEEGSPGTVIEYQLSVANVSNGAIRDIILRLDVPVGTVYLEGSEQMDRTAMLLQFSIDGGQTFRTPPIRYTVQQPDGSQVQLIAGPEEYTNLRLVLLRALEPGEEVIFTYRVEVE